MKILVIAAIVVIVISYVAYTYYKKSTACDESLVKQNAEHKLKMSKIEAILKDANTTIEKKEMELKKLGISLKEANEMLAKKEEELKKVNAILTDANTTIATKETELKKLGLTIQEANEMIAKKQEELKNIQSILKDANMTISTRDQELKNIQNILNDANTTIATKEAELQKLGLTIQEANQLIAKKEEELQKVNAILRNANTSISTKEEELKKLGLSVKQANEMIIEKEEELKKLGVNISEANATIVKKDADINVLQDKMASLTAEYEQKSAERDALINRANSSISSLTDTLNQRLNELNAEKQTNQENTGTIANINNQINELKQIIARKEGEFGNIISQKDAEINNINESLTRVGTQIREKEAEITRLNNLRETELKFIQEVLPRQQKEWNTIVDTILSGASRASSLDGVWTTVDVPLRITINGDNLRLDLDNRTTTGKISGDKVAIYDQYGIKIFFLSLVLKENNQLQVSINNGKVFLLNKGVKCNVIRIFDDQRGYLNLAQIVAYDSNKKMIPIAPESISMAAVLGDYPARNLVDRNSGTFAHNDDRKLVRSISINLPSPVIISSVVITNRQDCCKTRANGLMLSAQLDGNEVYKSAPVKDWSGSASYENGGWEIHNPNGYNYITFKLPDTEPIISQHPIITPFDALDTTYSDAEMTCEQKGMRLCNSDELCSGRDPNPELDIFGPADNWMAVGDRKDEWLTYNRDGDRVCKTHTQVAGGTPGWSQNYDGDWKRAAKCCENPTLGKIPDTKCSIEGQAREGMKSYVIRDNVLMGDDARNRIIIVPLTSRNTKITGSNKLTVNIMKGESLSLITDVKILKGDDVKGAWVQYEFNTPKQLTMYTTLNEVVPNASMTNWTIVGSNDGKNWKLIDQRKNINMTNVQTFQIDSSKQAPYRYMRWIAEKTDDVNHIFAFRFRWFQKDDILQPSIVKETYSSGQGDREQGSPIRIDGEGSWQRTNNYQQRTYSGSTNTTYLE